MNIKHAIKWLLGTLLFTFLFIAIKHVDGFDSTVFLALAMILAYLLIKKDNQ